MTRRYRGGMGRLDEVLDGVRRELGGETDVRDVPTAVDAPPPAVPHAPESALTGSAVARLLGITRQAVHQRAGRGSLVAVADAEGVRYPIWQFHDGSPVRGLLRLVRAARSAGVDEAALAAWIESDPQRMAALSEGDIASLVAHAGEARRPRTPVNRRQARGSAPRLTDRDAD